MKHAKRDSTTYMGRYEQYNYIGVIYFFNIHFVLFTKKLNKHNKKQQILRIINDEVIHFHEQQDSIHDEQEMKNLRQISQSFIKNDLIWL